MFNDQPGDCDRLRNITLNLFVIVILHVIILEIYQVSNTVLGRTFKVSLPVTKGTKHGLISLILRSRPFKVDLSVCVDVSVNPGPDSMPMGKSPSNCKRLAAMSCSTQDTLD